MGRRPKESDFSRLDDAKYLGRTQKFHQDLFKVAIA